MGKLNATRNVTELILNKWTICDKIVEKGRIYTFPTLKNDLIARLEKFFATCHSGAKKRGIVEWAQPENSEVSGTDLIKNRVSVPRISPCQGHSVLILVQMMDIIMLVQVVDCIRNCIYLLTM